MSFQKGVAVTGFTFTLVNATTGAALTSAASIVAKVSKDGGATTTAANAVTELSFGQYKITLTASEMNATLVALQITATNAVPKDFVFATTVATIDTVNTKVGGFTGVSNDTILGGFAAMMSVDASPLASVSGTFHPLFSSLETITDAHQGISTRIPDALVDGRIKADMEAISADTVAADALEAILDGTGAAVKFKSNTSTPAVEIESNGTGPALFIENNNSGPGISVYADTAAAVKLQGTTYAIHLLSGITDFGSTIFDGVTSFRDWLRALIRNDVAVSATALSEIGSGYDNTTSSLEAHRVTLNSIADDTIFSQKMLLADKIVDIGTTPWELVYIEAGTGGLGIGTELFRQALRDKDGNDITSTSQTVAQQTSV